uniref:Uncharacterized protein n=1 Tax=Anopheles coluzzii TaxID=1518534 RepID=A0A8W7Q2A3_ANOCL
MEVHQREREMAIKEYELKMANLKLEHLKIRLQLEEKRASIRSVTDAQIKHQQQHQQQQQQQHQQQQHQQPQHQHQQHQRSETTSAVRVSESAYTEKPLANPTTVAVVDAAICIKNSVMTRRPSEPHHDPHVNIHSRPEKCVSDKECQMQNKREHTEVCNTLRHINLQKQLQVVTKKVSCKPCLNAHGSKSCLLRSRCVVTNSEVQHKTLLLLRM